MFLESGISGGSCSQRARVRGALQTTIYLLDVLVNLRIPNRNDIGLHRSIRHIGRISQGHDSDDTFVELRIP